MKGDGEMISIFKGDGRIGRAGEGSENGEAVAEWSAGESGNHDVSKTTHSASTSDFSITKKRNATHVTPKSSPNHYFTTPRSTREAV